METNDGTTSVAADPLAPVHFERWPSEIPLRVLVILAALFVWFILCVSIVGVIYGLMLAVFFFVSHLVLVTHLRGNAVKLQADQFPALYRRVEELSSRLGLQPVPDAYLMQSGGDLNAFATKFFRSNIIVLYSDLLEACGDNESARDMIIGHELGHIKCGHLRWMWFLIPGMLVPFLGSAYSRAREFTCDRCGTAVAEDPQGALRGLAILAAGGEEGPNVNLEALTRQRADLNTGWMTLGKWLMSHPPLCERVAQLQPSLVTETVRQTSGVARAIVILAVILLVPIIGTAVVVVRTLPGLQEIVDSLEDTAALPPGQVEAYRVQVDTDLESLATVARETFASEGSWPADAEELYEAWRRLRPDQNPPLDPFDETQYGYWVEDGTISIWSSGPDGQSSTDDDIEALIETE